MKKINFWIFFMLSILNLVSLPWVWVDTVPKVDKFDRSEECPRPLFEYTFYSIGF